MGVWIAAVALPFVAGLHRYLSDRGYRGLTHGDAFDNAWCVTMTVAAIEIAVLILTGVTR